MPSALCRPVVLSVFVLFVAACGPGTDASFTRVVLAATIEAPLSGTSLNDIWGRTTLSGKSLLAHSSDSKKWATISLAAEGTTDEPQIESFVAGAANSAWVLTSDVAGPHLLKVSSKGAIDDRTQELPAITFEAGALSGHDDALILGLQVRGPGANEGKGLVYRRRGGVFEQDTALPAESFTFYYVVAVTSIDDFYVYKSGLRGFAFIHMIGTTAHVISEWTHNEIPVVRMSSDGEMWAWFQNGANEPSGIHGRGTSFTAWKATNWPKATAKDPTSHFPFTFVPISATAAALLVHSTDPSKKQASEMQTLRVMNLDAQGALTPGATLFACAVPDECAVGGSERLNDGSLVVMTGVMPPVYLTAPASAVK